MHINWSNCIPNMSTSWDNLSYAICKQQGADQHAHLISAFVVCCPESITPVVAISEISRLYLASVAEQTSLSLCWSHNHLRQIFSWRGSYEHCGCCPCTRQSQLPFRYATDPIMQISSKKQHSDALIHVCQVYFSILINWTSPFPVLGVSGVLFHFYSISNRYFC